MNLHAALSGDAGWQSYQRAINGVHVGADGYAMVGDLITR